ncbi:MAG: 50S ribosomal protein L6 [Rhabdochlamydiaceae bacterium]
MSRLSKMPISIPKGVEIKVEANKVHVKGPKGTLSHPLVKGISIKVEAGFAHIERDEKVEMPKPTEGLYRATLNNMVIGVSQGFEKRLSMIGVGYRAALQGTLLDLQVGNSHPTKLAIPKDVQVTVDKSVNIVITGTSKQLVGQVAATIRAVKPPEPYKGKGIRYEGEYVRKKAGKAAKAKTAAG